jgi:hypothetical protein
MVYSIWLMRPNGTLSQAAASVDRRLTLQDEITTAYWFIHNPRRSDWVDRQIARAAATIQRIDPTKIHPRYFPKSSLIAAGILLLFVFLNLSPGLGGRNWFALQAAPAYTLSGAERNPFERASGLLGGTEEGEKLQAVMQDLQAGKISAAEAVQQLTEIQAALKEERLDLEGIAAGLTEIGKSLEESGLFERVGETITDMKLSEAADELIASSKALDGNSVPRLDELQESLDKASKTSIPELKRLAGNLKEAASRLVQHSTESVKVGLGKAAQELQLLGSLIHNQQATDEASQQLQKLISAIEQRPYAEGGLGNAHREGIGFNTAPAEDTPSSDVPAGNESFGVQASGAAVPNPPRVGPPTSLRVELQREQLRGRREQQLQETEPSRKEISTTKYEKIESSFRPIPKDVMNRDEIPSRYRPLIRDYFQAIEPSK